MHAQEPDYSQKIGENTVRKLEVVVIMVCLTFVSTKYSCVISRIAVGFYFEKHREVDGTWNAREQFRDFDHDDKFGAWLGCENKCHADVKNGF